MATLSASDRKKMPAKEFLGPGRTFPGNDKSHLRAAITGAARSRNVGNISSAVASRIIAKARKKLGISAAERGAK